MGGLLLCQPESRPLYRSRLSLMAGLLLGLPVAPVGAIANPFPSATDDARTCDYHGALAEKALQLPNGLLRAIGRVESGRRDRTSGAFGAWPWTLNANGQGRFFADRSAAAAAVRALQAGGTPSVDTGCFQVNLHHHPQAFGSVEEAFDPAINAAYAGAFLQSLRGRLGSWEAAVAAYHSASPERGEPYRARVFAAWREQVPEAGTAARVGPVVIRISGPDLSGPEAAIRVWTPSRPGSAPARIALPQLAVMPAMLTQADPSAAAQ